MHSGAIARVLAGKGEWAEGPDLPEEGSGEAWAESGLLVHLSEGGQTGGRSSIPACTFPQLH